METTRELNVDVIGGQSPLTEKEKQDLSEFFRGKKLLREKQAASKKRDKRKKSESQ